MRPIPRDQENREHVSRALRAYRRRDANPDDAGVGAARGLLDILDVEGRVQAAYTAGLRDGALPLSAR